MEFASIFCVERSQCSLDDGVSFSIFQDIGHTFVATRHNLLRALPVAGFRRSADEVHSSEQSSPSETREASFPANTVLMARMTAAD